MLKAKNTPNKKQLEVKIEMINDVEDLRIIYEDNKRTSEIKLTFKENNILYLIF